MHTDYLPAIASQSRLVPAGRGAPAPGEPRAGGGGLVKKQHNPTRKMRTQIVLDERMEAALQQAPHTFSTVWHCEHLVLKIFAPALVDMVCCLRV